MAKLSKPKPAAKPRQRAPGAGRKKSSPMRQAQSRMQPCRRTDPNLPATAGDSVGLSGPPPPYLRAAGKFIWNVIVAQEDDARAKKIKPAITELQRALVERYARAVDHLAEIRKSQNRLRSHQPAGHQDLARWSYDGDGNVIGENPMWEAEVKYQKEMTEAAKALGITASNPMFSFQQTIADGSKMDTRLIGPHAEAARLQTVDAVDAEVVG